MPGEKAVVLVEAQAPILGVFGQAVLMRHPYPVGSFGGGRIIGVCNFDAKKLSLTLTDMTAPPGKQYLFHLPPHREKTAVIHAEKADEAGLYFTYCFSFCDREYQVVIRPTEAYFSAQPISPAIVYLVGCLLIVLLLSLYLLGRFQHLADAKELLQRDGSGI